MQRLYANFLYKFFEHVSGALVEYQPQVICIINVYDWRESFLCAFLS